MIAIGSTIGDALSLYRKELVTHVVAAVLFAVINGITMSIFYGPMAAGYMRGMEREAQGGHFELSDLFSCFNDRLGVSLIVGLLGLVIVGAGFLLCVIPGLLLLPLLPTAIYQVAVCGETDPIAAIKTGFGQLMQAPLMAMFTMLVLTVLGGIGSLLCGVGIFLTLPILNIGQWLVARQLNGDDSIEQPGVLS